MRAQDDCGRTEILYLLAAAADVISVTLAFRLVRRRSLASYTPHRRLSYRESDTRVCSRYARSVAVAQVSVTADADMQLRRTVGLRARAKRAI